jgi:hypothetical protein
VLQRLAQMSGPVPTPYLSPLSQELKPLLDLVIFLAGFRVELLMLTTPMPFDLAQGCHHSDHREEPPSSPPFPRRTSALSF